MRNLVFIAYYLFAAFVVYGIWYTVIILDESKWYLLFVTLLSISPEVKERNETEK